MKMGLLLMISLALCNKYKYILSSKASVIHKSSPLCVSHGDNNVVQRAYIFIRQRLV